MPEPPQPGRHSPDPPLPVDPLEEELVAYLDGELPEEEARLIEQRLANDPDLRRRALLLKKTYDLLDYLPQPVVSENFTTRTLEKIPAWRATATPANAPEAPAHPIVPSTSQPVLMTDTRSASSYFTIRLAPWKISIVLVLCLICGALSGYGLLSWTLSAPYPPPSASQELLLSDHRLIEMLPYYIGVDDLAFLLRLAEPELFGDEPLVENNPSRMGTSEAFELSPPFKFEELVREFQSLPASRQAALREFDRELFALENTEREYLLRILETYTLWLSRLSQDQQREILSAKNSAERLQRIRELREHQWVEALPPEHQKRLRSLSTQDRIETIRRLKRQESNRRETWSFIRRHAEEIAANRIPWPFHDEALRQAVVEFGRQAFQLDEPGKERLTANERQRYLSTLQAAEQTGGSAWFSYGREIYNLSRKYERFLLPPPQGKPVIEYADLGPSARLLEKDRAQSLTAPFRGRWPEFALAVLDYINTLPTHERPKLPPLGPSRLEELPQPLRHVIERELWPKLRPREREALAAWEGKWPEYCRELRKWAGFHDVSLPGIMLPGSPRRWDALYGTRVPEPSGLPASKFPPFAPLLNRK
jgi:hypothetical protein